MKRICSITLILCIAFSMVACHSKTPNPTIPPTIPTSNPTDPTVEPTEPTKPAFTVIRQEGPFSKEGVPEFMDLFNKTYQRLANTGDFQERDCYNDTPPGVFEETGIQIFSFEASYYKSFLMLDGTLYSLNENYYHAHTLTTHAIPFDFNGDGVKELICSLYVESTDGTCYDVIKVFDSISKKVSELYRKMHFDSSFALYVAETESNSQSPITVWLVKWDFVKKKEAIDAEKYLYDYTILSKTYTVTGIAGYLKTVDGSLQFVPYTE